MLKTLPIVSITKVLLTFDPEKPASPRTRIKEIIDDYNTNQNKTKKKMKAKKIQKPEYVPVESDIKNTLNINMDVDVYIQTMNYRSKVMGSLFRFKSHDFRYTETRNNFAIFCYFPDNSVYAITTNSAWTVVQNYRDPEFPQRIADRLLTLDGPKDHSNKPLFSDISKASERRKSGNKNRMDILDEPYIRLNYAARLRDDASVYSLKCFQKRKKKSPVNVEINYGSIRFHSLIIIDFLPHLINHLHTIYKKKPTFTTKKEEEEDSSVYKQYLREADFQVKIHLNQQLVENLRKCIQDNDDDVMENFELMHLKMDEFLDATEFRLGTKKDHNLIDEGPNLKIVITELRNQKNQIFNGIRDKSKDFRKELKNILIGFKGKPTSNENEDQLLNFLEGMITYDHLCYFRAFKKWYYVCEDFYRHIQDEFVSCLKDHLLDSKNKAILSHVWKNKMHEGPYNDGYMGEENFVVGDRTLTNEGIEIFDLLFHDKSTKTTYLYHVKKNFSGVARVVQGQLCNAASVVRNHFQNKDQKSLRDFYERLVAEYEKYNIKHNTNYSLPDFCAKYDDFVDLLDHTKNKLVFVYAVKIGSDDILQTGDATKKATLKNEKMLKNIIDPLQIQNLTEKLLKKEKTILQRALKCDSNLLEIDKDLSKKLFEALIQRNYTTKIENVHDSVPKAYVNSSLLLERKKNFQISDIRAADEIVYDILRPYRTYFKSLTAKLSVNKMRKQIEGMHHYKFKICEIMGETTDLPKPKAPKRKSGESKVCLNKNQKMHDSNGAPIPNTSQAFSGGV